MAVVSRRIDSLMSLRAQYICGALIGCIAYLLAGASQGDSAVSVGLQAAAGVFVGLAVVAAMRRLTRSDPRDRE